MNGATHYHLVIIGSGQAAGPLAKDAAANGWKVAVIESAHAGGTCVNTGCTPTKTLVAGAGILHAVRQAPQWGLNMSPAPLDWNVMRGRRNTIVEDFRNSSLRGLEQTEGIEFIAGRGMFVGPRTLEVLSADGSRSVTGDRIVLDVGGRSHIPDIPGLDQVPWVDSAGIQAVDSVPEHLIVLGGGYIGLEFGQMFHRFGSRVTVVHRGSSILSREDHDVSDSLKTILEKEGLDIITGAQTLRAESSGNGVSLHLKVADRDVRVEGSLILVAAGRNPDTADLGLEAAGIAADNRGFIRVDDNLFTGAEGVWAVGDCKGGPSFTHIAYDDYRILRDRWFGDTIRTTAGRPVPYTVFTDPQLGRIGLSEKEARAADIDYTLYKMPFSWVARAIESGRTEGLMKVLVSPESNRILGAAVLGMEGGEMATMLQLAMAGGVTAEELRNTIFAHPGLAESLNNLFAYGLRES